MASRSETLRQLEKLFSSDVLDIHAVADLVGMQRSSINNLISRPEMEFPSPFFELRGKNRHPLRLWWKADVETWISARSNSKVGKQTKNDK
jgi:predicted DNA-binding transcriptional regulator AlpA